MESVVYHGPIMLDEPEEFPLEEFVRQAIALEAERVFYSEGMLFLVDYDTIHGIVEDRIVIVEMITYSSFARVDEYKRWILYHGNDDVVEYTDKIVNLRGDTTILPVIRTGDRFVRKILEYIKRGNYRKFI
ncbi:allene oxide synthase, putative [Ferroglobus placidus DSM 10642]|uniref:Allene oxide synthase, putative n=1 Tax=Ferroglobus placidus (strain DSM 10642 / AEDII12DO) TaxID=589924 RepID=D3S0T7_FERPA|nr:hypothetical protein [Ferroglobus placidus]ADC66328.1 allene oxide synthase, putative [Ferroglobus placidus DSM 10642]